VDKDEIDNNAEAYILKDRVEKNSMLNGVVFMFLKPQNIFVSCGIPHTENLEYII
jgi:hypothetical protein